MPRLIYKLGTHSLKVKAVNTEEGSETTEYVEVPILSRCLKRTGELLKLDRATEEDIKVVRELETGGGASEGGDGGSQTGEGGEGEGSEKREVVYYRLGSWRADRIILVYEEGEEGEGGGEGGGNQGSTEGGDGSPQEGGEQQEAKTKRKTLRIPIPSWAPNYKVIPVLFSKAQAAGLKLLGAYRHGYMIPAPSQLGGGEEGGNGNTE
jgi:hypothetical protein